MSAVVRAIHAEWLRVFSLRTWWVLALVLVGYVGVTAGGLAFLVSSMGDTEQGACRLWSRQSSSTRAPRQSPS